MRYVSVCAGIEAATVAWHHLGWTPVAFSEIEPFPSAVLAHHYPNVPNLGDMTKFEEWNLESVELLVGGTPCQSFSVAGLRKGLTDPRGGLMLTYLEIARRYRPRWIVWENVPGVLSSNGGRDFGSFLGALGELGYGFAYRVLDAQWFGVAQRRRRVFVVGYLGDWRRAAAVLFESESVQRNPAPSREARKEVAASAAAGVDERGLQLTVGTLCADTHPGAYSGQDAYTGRLVPYVQPFADPITANEGRTYTHEGANNFRTRNVQAIPIHDQATRFAGKRGDKQDGKGNGFGVGIPGDPAPTLTKGDKHAVAQVRAGSHWDSLSNPHPTLNQSAKISGGIAASDQELFSQRGSGLVAQPVATDLYNGAIDGEATHSLRAGNGDAMGGVPSVMQPVPFREPAPTLTAKMQGSSGWAPANEDAHLVGQGMQVRRLTPVECERLQGFPDNYTNIPWRKKDEAPDGPRYKALGNSMAVPVMRWIGERIAREEAQ